MSARAFARRARGVVLVVALVVLVAMSLAGIALMRSVAGGLLVAGNIAFKRGATAAADRGVEVGRQWLINLGTAPDNDVPADGYYASWRHDPTAPNDPAKNFVAAGHDWDNASGPVNAGDWNPLCGAATHGDTIPPRGCVDAEGFLVRFVTHRMCATTGPTSGDTCLLGAGSAGQSSNQSITYGGGQLTAGSGVYFRVTARVDGPKRTVSYVQTVLTPR